MIKKDTIDTILRKFLTQRRMPRYENLTDAERNAEYDKEKNITMYLSSAYFSDHWSYQKCVDTVKQMAGGNKRHFIVSLPYQLSIKEGLLDRDVVQDEMLETDFSDIKFMMEYLGLFYGATENAFFNYNSIATNRKIKYPIMPDDLSSKIQGAKCIKIPDKERGEVRILSADIALMSSKKNKNDATSIIINFLKPTKAGRYVSNIVYIDSCEGLRTDDQALIIRKLYDEYMCDYIVLDSNGIGLGVFDCLARDINDRDSGQIYPALSCCNDKTMADRCTVQGAAKVIWSIKASAQLNSDCAYLVREGFRSGRIRLLTTEYDAEESLRNLKGFSNLEPNVRVKYNMPFIHTTLLIDEMVNLRHYENSGKVKIMEKYNMRKDRYSSLSYNYYVAVQIENKLTRKNNISESSDEFYVIRPPKDKRKAVNMYGDKRRRW